MLCSRSSFGCTVNLHKNEIYVAGGYTHGNLTKRCEVYSIVDNQWRELPPLNEEKCSQTLVVLGGRYLYSLGGLTKQEAGAYLLSSIEVLDLASPTPRWEMLPIKLPHQSCDIGALPLDNLSLLIYGGWNKQASQNAFIMRQSGRD